MVPVVCTPNKLEVARQHRCILEIQGTYARSGSLIGEKTPAYLPPSKHAKQTSF